MNLTQRAALPGDEEFLFTLHKAAMQQYVEATWGTWHDAVQREQFHECFHPEEMRVIQLDGQDAGVIHVLERSEEFFIASLEVLPALQGRGIGTWVIRQVIERANQSKKMVALQVLKINKSARALYQRLGFGITGENDTYYFMAYGMC